MGAMRQLRRAAWERERGRCAATGLPLGDPDGDRWNLHHRRPGGMGGTRRANQDTLPNVVALLAEAHNMGAAWLPVEGVTGRSVHGDPDWSGPLGLLLSPSVDNPGEVPVRVAGVGWVFLDEAGGYVPLA
jgi:hypothetical protein